MTPLSKLMHSLSSAKLHCFPSDVSEDEQIYWIGFAISKIEDDVTASRMLHSLTWEQKKDLLLQLGAFARAREKSREDKQCA